MKCKDCGRTVLVTNVQLVHLKSGLARCYPDAVEGKRAELVARR